MSSFFSLFFSKDFLFFSKGQYSIEKKELLKIKRIKRKQIIDIKTHVI
jgi:hypothetical protein